MLDENGDESRVRTGLSNRTNPYHFTTPDGRDSSHVGVGGCV
jgi:hypothetical protein